MIPTTTLYRIECFAALCILLLTINIGYANERISFPEPLYQQILDDTLKTEDSTEAVIDTPETTINTVIDSTVSDTLATASQDTLATENKEISLREVETEDLKFYYRVDSIKLNKKEIISNVLFVINKSSEQQTIKIDNLYPAGWQNIIVFEEETQIISPGDTLFFPIILIPSKGFRAGSNISINTILKDSADQIIGGHYFSIYSDRKISWETTVSPDNKVYLKNDQTEGIINYNLKNTGPYDQDFFVKLKPIGSRIIVTDTTDKIVKDNATLSIKSGEDTSIVYKLKAHESEERNLNRISTLNYIPDYQFGRKKYTLFIESRDPNMTNGMNIRGDKVDFIKLPNEIYASNLSNRQLPLEVELNVQNLLNDNVLTSLNLRGLKQLNDDATLVYFSQFNYNSIYIDNQFIRNAPWYVGYFDSKIQAEIGQISGNIIGINNFGRGAKFSYRFNEKNQTGAFYVRNPRLFDAARTEGYGVFHEYKPKENLRFRGALGRSANYARDSRTNAANLNSYFSIRDRHFFSTLLAGTNTVRNFTGAQQSFNGFLAGLNYATNFLERRIRTAVNARYNDRNFSSGGFERFQVNHISNYRMNEKWSAVLSNFFADNSAYNMIEDTLLYDQRVFTNSLLFNNVRPSGSYQPGIYYDYTDILNYPVHGRGLLFRYSNGSFRKNFLISTFFKAGYNDPIDLPDVKNFFTLINTTILRYRTWNFSFQYNYGPNSKIALDRMLQFGITPQNIRLNTQNQYQFRNEHFVIENSLTYSYNNIFQSHNAAYFPQLFYFTNTGWRFAINANLVYNSNDFGSFYNNLSIPDDTEESTTNQTFNVNFGFSVRKEFNIPIPFIKAKSVNCNLVSFYDLNGDGLRDQNEPTIENVVIKIDNKSELITDQRGIGKVRNIELGMHKFDLTVLEGIQGWFPNIEDSLEIEHGGNVYLPFVRGVKVYGEVILDLQDIAVVDKDKKVDLSRIKITATNGKVHHTLTDVNGKFEFYLPNGDYIITMDEKILGSKYVMSNNNIPVLLNFGQNDVYISFYVSEKKRAVKIKEF